MDKTIRKKVKICDRCKDEIEKNQYFRCPVCKRECCWNRCKSEWLSNYPDVCKDCILLPEIKRRKERYIQSYWKRFNKEKEELSKIKIKKHSKCKKKK